MHPTSSTDNDRPQPASVAHKFLTVDGMRVFYREAGTPGASVVLLPHGYPCSSYQYRNLMPLLSDRWHVLAPDYPGFGYSDTPASFNYGFGGYSEFLDRFTRQLDISRYVLYLHDYGSQIGLRLAIRAPERIRGLIIQNGDIYEDVLGPKYAGLKEHWRNPNEKTWAKLRQAVSEEGFREEFIGEVRPELAECIPPDLWRLSWSQMTPQREGIMLKLMEQLKDNLAWFPRYQAYLREHQPPTLILWGPQDGYMPEAAGRAYLRDLPRADLHFIDSGHWLLETHLEQAAALIRQHLVRLDDEQ